MQEFVFLCDECDEIVLNDEIKVLTKPDDKHYLVSNSKKLKAEVYAPEIDFYLKFSSESTLEKARNSLALYEIKATSFDLDTSLELSKEVGKRIILIDKDDNGFDTMLNDDGYMVKRLESIKFVYGQIGELIAILEDGSEVEFDILLVNGASEYMLRQSGCYDIACLCYEEIRALVANLCPKFTYKKVIDYDEITCQYAKRRTSHCSKCVDICPSVAILKDEETRELVFSDVDCVECGKCVSICPSGSLDFKPFMRENFTDIIKFYQDHIVLIMDNSVNFDNINLSLKSKVLPFFVDSVNFLDQDHLLNFIQTSGANIVIWTKNLALGTKESVDLINEIYQKIHALQAIYLASDENLQESLDLASTKAEFLLDVKMGNLKKKESFSKRLETMVGNGEFGVIASKEWLRYGKISVNADACTLCLSCVGACNTGALYADKSENALKFKASLCTTCGYCETSCAEENVLKIHRDGLELKSSFFEYQTMAKDELFECCECGKAFATKKSVEKIATMLKPLFAGDEARIRTLYCCADCKAKIMLKEQIKGVEI